MATLSLAVWVLALGGLLTPNAFAQAPCTGLCLQQVTCPNGGTTTISGVVYAPNGTDPLPNVLIYIPNSAVDPFTPGVSCQTAGQIPSGSPLVGATSAVDGSFTLTNVPVNVDLPLVIQSGKWRRQVTIPAVSPCTSTTFSTRLPRNQGEGDIPKFAIATGSRDALECVLRKVGIDDTEFTNPGGTGRVQLFKGSGSGGAVIDTNTPLQGVLTATTTSLNAYDVVMFPCQGAQFNQSAAEKTNLVTYANAGGRVFATHYGYVWLYDNGPFAGTANWSVNQGSLPAGEATVDISFPGGQTLAQWLQLVGASTTPGQMSIANLFRDQTGVIAPTQSWLTLNDSARGNPIMQFTFNTPIGAPKQCGRVLFNEYHVENPVVVTNGAAFPSECTSAAMTPQEKLLEYSLFDLSGNGSGFTLTPTEQDFGAQPVGFASSPAKTFTLTNNSIFPVAVTSIKTDGDFAATSSCSSVAAGGTCPIAVTFAPTALGARTGSLTVAFSGTKLSSSLTGNGIPDLQVSSAALDFGRIDVGAISASQTVIVTNTTSATIPLATPVVSGDFGFTTTCSGSLPSSESCSVTLNFRPTATGPRTGTLSVNSGTSTFAGTSTALTGTGIDFSIALTPTSGKVVAGYDTTTTATLSPIAGYASPVHLTCTTTAPGSTCVPAATTVILNSGTTVNIAITTTSKFTVIGYGGNPGLLSLFSIGCGFLLWISRRRAAGWARYLLLILFLSAASLFATGCSGKLPDANSPYTAPGGYTYTVTASDGILTHSATYALDVTAK
jgi:hypothetical protein